MHARQVEIPCHHTVKTDAATTVRRHACTAEDVDVLLDALAGGVDALLANSCLELFGVVDTLTSPATKLAANLHHFYGVTNERISWPLMNIS